MVQAKGFPDQQVEPVLFEKLAVAPAKDLLQCHHPQQDPDRDIGGPHFLAEELFEKVLVNTADHLITEHVVPGIFVVELPVCRPPEHVGHVAEHVDLDFFFRWMEHNLCF